MSGTDDILRLVDLTGYQRRLLEDRSRFIICMWPRQTGKSFGLSLAAILDVMEFGGLWVILSRGERQSREVMAKVAMLLRALNHVIQEVETSFRADDTTFKQLEIVIPKSKVCPKGGRIVALPANPDTARGFSGNVILDEFAFHKDSRAIWTALYPCITRGYRIIVASTPNGKQNKFYELWEHGGPQWSRHRLDIYQAFADGLRINLDELREGIGDPDAWAQEYECQFVDEATAFLAFDLIDRIEDDLASKTPAAHLSGAGDLYMGVDVARRRDFTVMWICERVGDVLWTREVLRLEKTLFRHQREALFERLSLPNMRRCCIDATGLGMQLAEEAVERFGLKVEPVTFTAAVKEDLATHLRTRCEDRLVRIPKDALIRQDLHSVQKVTTVAGNVRYDAERSEAGGGHADHFWALGLCTHAADTAPRGRIEYTQVQARRFGQQRGCW